MCRGNESYETTGDNMIHRKSYTESHSIWNFLEQVISNIFTSKLSLILRYDETYILFIWNFFSSSQIKTPVITLIKLYLKKYVFIFFKTSL